VADGPKNREIQFTPNQIEDAITLELLDFFDETVFFGPQMQESRARLIARGAVSRLSD